MPLGSKMESENEVRKKREKQGAQRQCERHPLGPLKQLESTIKQQVDGSKQSPASRMAIGMGMAIGIVMEMGMGMRMVGMRMRMVSKAQARPSCRRHGGG